VLLAPVGILGIGAIAAVITWAVVEEDDPPPPAEAPISGPILFPPEELPPSSTPIGRIGIFDPMERTSGFQGGQFQGFDLGHDGATALRGGQIGLTQTFSQIVQLTDDTFLCYRSVDEYAVVVQWAEDGSVPIVFTPLDFGGGWTSVERIGPGLLASYDSATGRAQLAQLDDAGAITAQVPVVGWRAGWSELAAVSDGRAALYDRVTGEAQVVRVDADGTFEPEAPVQVGPGWTTLVPLGSSIVLLGDGATGSLRAVDLSTPGSANIGDLAQAAPWTAAVSPAEGRFLLYERTTGAGRLGQVEGTRLVLGPEVVLPSGGGKLISRP
jgi:hypothetical protein